MLIFYTFQEIFPQVRMNSGLSKSAPVANGVVNSHHLVNSEAWVQEKSSAPSNKKMTKEDNSLDRYAHSSCVEDNSNKIMIDVTLQRLLTELEKNQKANIQIEKQADIGEQWRNVAAMYDRILFIVFLSVVLGITVWFLTLNPTPEPQKQ